MKLAAGAAVLALVVLVFVLTAPPELPPEVEPPEAIEEPMITTTTEAAVTRTGPPSVSRVLGVLPDGTRYSIQIDPGVPDRINEVGMVFYLDLESGLLPVGEVDVRFSPSSAPGYRYGLYRMSAGDLAVTIHFSGEALEALGPEAEEVITSSMRLDTTRGLPVLELDPPFRWATGFQQVEYESFVVRNGCDAPAVACSQTGAVQVIPKQRVDGTEEPWPDPEVSISANVPRPEWHHTFLDPGPLSPRTGYDVVWSGTEMIVWGGIGEEGFLIDGAGFDPSSNEWRMLSPPPIAEQPTTAAWAGEVMVVVSEEATLIYDSRSDGWSVVADGRVPIRDAPSPVWDGDYLYLWQNGIERLDVAAGEWQAIPAPPFEVNPNPMLRSLQVVERSLFAASSPDPCGGARSLAHWDGTAWTDLPGPELSGRFRDCSPPRHTGVVSDWLMVWNSSNGTALRFNDSTGGWEPAHGLPVFTADLTTGGLAMDDRLLIARLGEGALYRLDGDQWRTVALPGWGDASQMVWTGEEVLMWGDGDAWRWRPPES